MLKKGKKRGCQKKVINKIWWTVGNNLLLREEIDYVLFARLWAGLHFLKFLHAEKISRATKASRTAFPADCRRLDCFVVCSLYAIILFLCLSFVSTKSWVLLDMRERKKKWAPMKMNINKGTTKISHKSRKVIAYVVFVLR